MVLLDLLARFFRWLLGRRPAAAPPAPPAPVVPVAPAPIDVAPIREKWEETDDPANALADSLRRKP